MHHDFAVLPNGHIVVVASESLVENGLTGYPNTQPVLGDVLIDLDQNHKPVWVWSSFDHLDLNRHPFNLPDWTHTNSVVYSPDDKALIISMRNQSWVMKINYNDGSGRRQSSSGSWATKAISLFKTAPIPRTGFMLSTMRISSAPTASGVFQLTLFDDGDQRVFWILREPFAARLSPAKVEPPSSTRRDGEDGNDPVGRQIRSGLIRFLAARRACLQNGNVESDFAV